MIICPDMFSVFLFFTSEVTLGLSSEGSRSSAVEIASVKSPAIYLSLATSRLAEHSDITGLSDYCLSFDMSFDLPLA